MQFVILLVCLIKSQSTLAGLRIYGGRDANQDEFPYAIAMRYQVKKTYKNGEIKAKYIPRCSGALLSPTWYLTAAHCIGPDFNETLKNFPPSTKLVLAYQDLSKISEIKWGVMQPSYKTHIPSFSSSSDNDIGLLHSEPMVLKQYAKLSPLQYTTLTGFEATSLGYGRTENSKPVKIYFNTTLKVLKTVIIRCHEVVTNSMRSLCLRHACADVGMVCVGDSGGPLVHASGVVGVTSLGNSPCDVKEGKKFYLRALLSSGIIVPTSPHIDWISRIITDPNNNK